MQGVRADRREQTRGERWEMEGKGGKTGGGKDGRGGGKYGRGGGYEKPTGNISYQPSDSF